MLFRVESARNKINTDQINEFILQGNKPSFFGDDNIAKIAETQGFLNGIESVVHNAAPQESEVSTIWHKGYERGLSQTEFIGEMEYEKGHANGFRQGQEENMKAIQTIIKSGDNVTNALKIFSDSLQNKEEKPNNIAEPKPAQKVEKK